MIGSKFSRRQLVLGGAGMGAGRVLGAGVPHAPAAGQLKAGASLANITPALGCSMMGGFNDNPAREVHDELHVRSLVLDNGQARIAIALCDLCVLPPEIMQRARQAVSQKTSIPVPHILLATTHTHSAPATIDLAQSPPDAKYLDWLVVRIADGVQRAVNHLEPARIGWGVGREPRLVFNRRYIMKPGTIPPNPFGVTGEQVQTNPGVGNPNVVKPAGPVDPEVGVVAVESLEGRPIAVLGNYALHYVGGVGPGHISADYFGAWGNAMARLAGVAGSGYPAFVPILSNGCSGDINAVDVMGGTRRRYRPYELIERYADILAAESYRTWRAVEFQDAVELGATQTEVELGVRLPNAGELADARAKLAAVPNGRPFTRDEVYARNTIIMGETWQKTAKVVVQALRIGSLGIATLPGEAFVQMGLDVKAKSPFKTTVVIELANDFRGYIPTPEQHQLGGYETWRIRSSYLEKQAAPKLVAAAVGQLAALHG